MRVRDQIDKQHQLTFSFYLKMIWSVNRIKIMKQIYSKNLAIFCWGGFVCWKTSENPGEDVKFKFNYKLTMDVDPNMTID